MKKLSLRSAIGITLSMGLLMTAAACGGGSGGGGGTGSFSNAQSLTVLNAVGTGSGTGNVSFTAADKNGAPIIASLKSNSAVKVALMDIIMPDALADTGGSGGLTCTITAPSGTTCDVTNITSTPSKAGTGGVIATGIDIDNTGSMAGTDPSHLRQAAAQSFIDELAKANNKNAVSIFDFFSGIPVTAPFTASRMDFAWTVLTDSTAASNAKAAVVVEDGGSTNLFDSVLEICEDMSSTGTNAHFANAVSHSNTIDSVNVKTMLILTDGDDNSSTHTVTDVVNCLKTGNIVAYTIGLAPGGSGISATGQDALEQMANANGGIFAIATDASALTPLFQAIAGATISGFNTAILQLSPAPAAGTQVSGNISNGTATANFTFIAK